MSSRRTRTQPHAARRAAARLLLTLTVIGALAGAGHWGWQWLQRTDVMPLSRVAVNGEMAHLQRDQLEAVVSMAVWGNFLTVDIDKVRTAALSLPWVERASVRRVWPDGLEIRVVERRPFARWGEAGLINAQGDVFYPASLEGMEKLPLLEGRDERSVEVLERYRSLSTLLSGVGAQLQRLRLDDRGGWRLWLGDGLEIVLGKEDTEARLDRVIWLLQQMSDELPRLERIDARYANGMAIRWKPVESEPVETLTAAG